MYCVRSNGTGPNPLIDGHFYGQLIVPADPAIRMGLSISPEVPLSPHENDGASPAQAVLMESRIRGARVGPGNNTIQNYILTFTPFCAYKMGEIWYIRQRIGAKL